MASLSREVNGRRTIQFIGVDQKRRSIRLGKVSQRSAETIRIHVERLVERSLTRCALARETADWLLELEMPLYDKLVSVGLAEPRESALLEPFLDSYIAKRIDVKSSTATVYGHTRRCLIEHFGSGKPIDAITEGDADEWRLYLVGQKLAKATIAKRCSIAKQFFRAALRKQLIATNPFAHLKGAVRGNPERQYFVSNEESAAVIAACPDAQWRLLFALARYGGLRCPSEHLALRWVDVDWERGCMTIHAAKTEHHEGKATRRIPIFPELRPYLLEVFELAEPGTAHVITRYRDAATNLRTQFERIIKRAGLTAWPKLFQNLRATRATELARGWPQHIVSAWLGHSETVAQEHYLQITEEDFRRASGLSLTKEAVQNPVQQPAEAARNEPQAKNTETAKSDNGEELQLGPNCCENLRDGEMGVTGLEPVTSSV